jgi:hypothetical protein
LALVYGPNAGGLAYRVAEKADRPAGVPIAWDTLAAVEVGLPPDVGAVVAIYPESTTYQDTAVGLHVAIVGALAEHVVRHVALEGD